MFEACNLATAGGCGSTSTCASWYASLITNPSLEFAQLCNPLTECPGCNGTAPCHHPDAPETGDQGEVCLSCFFSRWTKEKAFAVRPRLTTLEGSSRRNTAEEIAQELVKDKLLKRIDNYA